MKISMKEIALFFVAGMLQTNVANAEFLAGDGNSMVTDGIVFFKPLVAEGTINNFLGLSCQNKMVIVTWGTGDMEVGTSSITHRFISLQGEGEAFTTAWLHNVDYPKVVIYPKDGTEFVKDFMRYRGVSVQTTSAEGVKISGGFSITNQQSIENLIQNVAINCPQVLN